MKFCPKMKMPVLLLALLMAFCISGCAMGFNKNGFYCTEGPVTDDTRPCFGKAPVPSQPSQPAATVQPEVSP